MAENSSHSCLKWTDATGTLHEPLMVMDHGQIATVLDEEDAAVEAWGIFSKPPYGGGQPATVIGTETHSVGGNESVLRVQQIP